MPPIVMKSHYLFIVLCNFELLLFIQCSRSSSDHKNSRCILLVVNVFRLVLPRAHLLSEIGLLHLVGYLSGTTPQLIFIIINKHTRLEQSVIYSRVSRRNASHISFGYGSTVYIDTKYIYANHTRILILGIAYTESEHLQYTYTIDTRTRRPVKMNQTQPTHRFDSSKSLTRGHTSCIAINITSWDSSHFRCLQYYIIMV